MTITIPPDLEAVIIEKAKRQRISPEEFVMNVLREALLPKQREAINGFVPHDDREEQLLSIGIDCGVSLSNKAVSSEGIYD